MARGIYKRGRVSEHDSGIHCECEEPLHSSRYQDSRRACQSVYTEAEGDCGMVLYEDVTEVFRDYCSGTERVIPAHYGEVFFKRECDEEDMLMYGVEMMTPSW